MDNILPGAPQGVLKRERAAARAKLEMPHVDYPIYLRTGVRFLLLLGPAHLYT